MTSAAVDRWILCGKERQTDDNNNHHTLALITILCEYFRKTLLTLRDAIHGSANKQTRPVEYTVYVYVLCF